VWRARDARPTRNSEPPEAHPFTLWERYWKGRDLSDRNELIIAYKALTRKVVKQLPSEVRRSWDAGDLESFGTLGLIEAIDRFDESSRIEAFPMYARKRIRGAIFDELRRLDWLPRTIRRRVIDYRSVVDDLSSELGRTPNRSEVFSTMGVDRNGENDVLQQVQSAQLARFDEFNDEENALPAYEALGQFLADAEGEPEHQYLAVERTTELRHAIQQLPERQRTVITLYFIAGLTHEQIGGILSISNSRVSQINAAAIESIRRLLNRKNIPPATALG
jgi:RNA polymerase sigma factor for flagellar operon FliA